jgi:hypothetical protein
MLFCVSVLGDSLSHIPQIEVPDSERAKRVMEYPAAKGVAGNRMRIIGSGGLRLKETEIAEANRRVEIRIIEYLN